MHDIEFCKFHGFGNDYIVIQKADAGTLARSALAAAICDRNTGAGSDGIAVLEKLDGETADYFCDIVNPDGTTAGFSGNGTRCTAAYLYYKGLWSESTLRLETRSGVKTFRLIERRGQSEFWFEAEIGKPQFESDKIPVKTTARQAAVVNEDIVADGSHFIFSAVNVGNPVACIFVDGFDKNWRAAGKALESHERFPERANIVFVQVKDAENLEIRIWERGAGETAASGTCAAGAAVLSSFLLKTGRRVRVHSQGGISHVLWREDDEIVLAGRADLAYCGTWPAL